MRIARRNGLDWRTKGALHSTSLTNYHVRSQPPLLMAYSAITIPTSVEACRAFLQGERKLTVTSGLCQGYKRRLDALKPLKYLEQNFVPLANQAFSDVESEATLHEMLRELHDYLLLKYRLLTRVIGAGKLHPSRFFSMNMDYGHQRYIDNIQNKRHITVRARKARKNGQKRCYSCSKNGSSGPGSRVNEKKKIKRETALFQR